MTTSFTPPPRTNSKESPLCKHGCGRMCFRKFETCCTHCRGIEGPHAQDCEDKQKKMKAEHSGEKALGSDWYWGHVDSRVEPPEGEPTWMDAITLPLKLMPNHKYYRDFARFALCPSFLDAKAKKHDPPGCPFLGGVAYLRHVDVKSKLEKVTEEQITGQISRQNELGYFLLGSEAFPMNHTLCLGCPVEKHRVQRQWVEYLLHPTRLPDRGGWIKEIQTFLAAKKRIKLKSDVAKWWQQMLWRHLLKTEISLEEASAFGTFQEQWLASSVVEFPNQLADHLPGWVPTKKSKVWSIERVNDMQASYRTKIESVLPADVPAQDRSLAAQGVLEALVFAGGLSVPQTIQAALAVLFSPGLLPSPVSISDSNVEQFVYEVTRLFPAVQGFCLWRDGKREILSLNAALRDPAVWGEHTANRFSLKDLELYKANHVGFANQAASRPGTFDSKSCPGYQLTLDVVQAFVLVLSSWELLNTCAASGQPLIYWTAVRAPQPCPVPTWWKTFELECMDWLDGDMTGEDLLFKDMNPIELGRILANIEKQPEAIVRFLGMVGLKKLNFAEQRKLTKLNIGVRAFYELTKMDYHELHKHAGSGEPGAEDRAPAQKFPRYYELRLDGDAETIKLPMPVAKSRKMVTEGIIDVAHSLYKAVLDDSVDESVVVNTPQQRQAAIALCQEIFRRENKIDLTTNQLEHSLFRADSYLPKPPHPFPDLTTDKSQVAIARCGIGQLFLCRNKKDHLAALGDVVCDASLLGDFEVRPGFERLGASAVFKCESSGWRLTAIDWKHGERTVLPEDPDWEHAKWVWRCSLFTYMTAVHHLMWCHWIAANSVTASSRETLSPEHPIRRLLQVFTYNTVKVNYKSVGFLYPEMGVLHRMTPFPYKELKRIFTVAADSYRFQTWPQYYDAADLPDTIKSKLPIFEDGLPLWDVLHKFCSGYVNVYYATDDAVIQDAELFEYWKFSCARQYTRGLPPLSKDSLIDQLTRASFDVTAYHELVGGAVDYTTDPAGASMQVRSGFNMSDMQELVLVNSLVCSTGSPVPMLVASGEVGDEEWFSHLDLSEWQPAEKFVEVKQLYDDLMERLRSVSQDVRRRNKTGDREHPFGRFDPLIFERSVSL